MGRVGSVWGLRGTPRCRGAAHERAWSVVMRNATGRVALARSTNITATMDPTAACREGIRSSEDVCCARSCGRCERADNASKRGCSSLPGGRLVCCSRVIKRSHRQCTSPSDVGCLIYQVKTGRKHLYKPSDRSDP